jgi:hypothetical protein
MKFCSASSASASVWVTMKSIRSISSSSPTPPRVDGAEKCDATRFLIELALPTYSTLPLRSWNR